MLFQDYCLMFCKFIQISFNRSINKVSRCFIVFIVFSGIPIFLIPNLWDATSFDYGFLVEDLSGIKAFYNEILKNRPETIKGSKGSYIKKIFITSTMGFGLEINLGGLK